jgi:hypothetical protein
MKNQVFITISENGKRKKNLCLSSQSKSIIEIIDSTRKKFQECSVEFYFQQQNSIVCYQPYAMDIDYEKICDAQMKFSDYAKKWYKSSIKSKEFQI